MFFFKNFKKNKGLNKFLFHEKGTKYVDFFSENIYRKYFSCISFCLGIFDYHYLTNTIAISLNFILISERSHKSWCFYPIILIDIVGIRYWQISLNRNCMMFTITQFLGKLNVKKREALKITFYICSSCRLFLFLSINIVGLIITSFPCLFNLYFIFTIYFIGCKWWRFSPHFLETSFLLVTS